MSFVVTGLVWKSSLKGIDKLVALRLADYANDDGSNIFPSIHTVALQCGIYDRTVQRSFRCLQDLGVLIRIRPADYGRKVPTKYRLDLPRLALLTGVTETPLSERHRWPTDTGVIRAPVSEKTMTGVTETPNSISESISKNPVRLSKKDLSEESLSGVNGGHTPIEHEVDEYPFEIDQAEGAVH
jgi:Helix-turn-helix domain